MQATLNVFADMHVLPASLDPALGLVLPEPSIDTTLPTSKVNHCVTGVDGQFETCHGSAMDGGGGVVASVEWSTDDGATWHPVGGMAVANELGEGAARYHGQRAVSVPLVINPCEGCWETTLIGSGKWLCDRCQVPARTFKIICMLITPAFFMTQTRFLKTKNKSILLRRKTCRRL